LYDGAWFIDFDHLRQQISSRTRALILVNPNNPTGSFLKKHELRSLLDLASRHELPIVCDEVFSDYLFREDSSAVRTLASVDSILTFSLNGLSKSAGMPQMKLGWITVTGPEREVQMARARMELILDTYLSVSTPVQRVASELFEIGGGVNSEIFERARGNLETLRSTLTNVSAHPLAVEGGWSAIVQLPATRSEEEWVRRLVEEQSLIVQPGYFFDMQSEPFVVVSLITPLEIFREGIERLKSSTLA
jgi:aspartate/methionine/tyrosine aminotransferase